MNTRGGIARCDATRDFLRLEWAEGDAYEFAAIWLRDNLPGDRDAVSGQRTVDIADLPADPRIHAAELRGDRVIVTWASDDEPTAFGLEWLCARAGRSSDPHGLRERTRPWAEGTAGAAVSTDFAWRSLAEVRTHPVRKARWLTELQQKGMAFLHSVPLNEDAILEVAGTVGRLVETNYGSVFDVRSVPAPPNLAYTDRGLGLHTDNPYRDPVPGFQVLHALVVTDDGGTSVFADGFAIAEHLRATAPAAYDLLTRHPVPFHYRASDADLYAERPLIQVSCRGEIAAVHYNSRSVAPLPYVGRDAAVFYAAYRRFADLLRDPRFHLTHRLRAGEAVVFDNHRILHGRTAFSSASRPRHLRGCYLSRDSVYSEAALARRRAAQEP